jgi:hypothetical protein
MTSLKSFPDEIERFIRLDALRPAVTFDQISQDVRVRFGPSAPGYDEIATAICHTFPWRAQLARFRRDPVMTAWIAVNMDTGTIAQIRLACIARFGVDRTQSYTGLAVHLRGLGRAAWRKAPPSPPGPPIAPLIAHWIRQVAPGLTVSALHAALSARFPSVNVPSRSALHRHLRRRGIETAGHARALDRNLEMGRWLRENARSNTLSELRREAVARFGADVASRSAIHRFLQANLPAHRKPRPGCLPDVEAWILEQRGTGTLDQIRAAALQRFGPARIPSRSAIQRRIRREVP